MYVISFSTYYTRFTMSPDPNQVLRVPFQAARQVPDNIHQKIAIYFAKVIGKRRVEVALHVPHVMDIWGKFRITGKSDSIRTAFSIKGKPSTIARRNSSYVRVCTHFPCFSSPFTHACAVRNQL